MSVVMGVLAAALLVAGGAAVILWRHILDWSLDHLLPWIEANVPWLAGPMVPRRMGKSVGRPGGVLWIEAKRCGSAGTVYGSWTVASTSVPRWAPRCAGAE